MAAVIALLAASASLAAGSGMPGDRGKPGGADGIPAANPPPQSIAPRAPVDRAPASEWALKVALAVARECSQFALGVAVANSKGEPILVYIPDGSAPNHSYTAIRKAYSAVTLNARTSAITQQAQEDPAFAGRFKTDPNLVAYNGGIPLRMGTELVGALGVSGAEPGHHDEECGLKALATVDKGGMSW